MNATIPDNPATTDRRVRVFLVEDHAIVRQGLTMLINDERDMSVCGGSDSATETVAMIRSLRPDVAIVDISLPDGSGLDLIRDMHLTAPAMPILALSMHDELLYAERALRAGASGYVMKREATDRVLTALRRVMGGEIYLSEPMASRILHKLVRPGETKDVSPTQSLTSREFEVFNLIAAGVGPSDIAKKLSLSVKTVETHRQRIKDKLGIKSGAELIRYAMRWLSDEG